MLFVHDNDVEESLTPVDYKLQFNNKKKKVKV